MSISQQTAAGEQECPQCEATVPVYSGYVTWCDKCNWNLQPHEPDPPGNIFEAGYASISKKLSHSLFNKLLVAPSLKPTLSVSKALAFAVAASIHGFTLLLFFLGLILIVMSWPFVIFLFVGLLCLGAAWVLRPRPHKLGKEDHVVLREDLPTLYALADNVAQALGASKVDVIVIDESFNASFAQVGWRQKRVMYIGLPLFSILNGGEKVALVSHEIAHGVNGDLIRGFFVGTAINSLATWHYILHPDRMMDDDPTAMGLGCLTVPGNLLSLGISKVVKWITAGLLHLLWRDSQRAEYLADALAASVSGTDSALATLEKLHLGNAFSLTVQKVALSPRKHQLFEELRGQVVNVPSRELERIRRVEKLPNSRLDTTHPPTVYRIEMLRAHFVEKPKVALSPEEFSRMEQELADFEDGMQQKLVEESTNSLYY